MMLINMMVIKLVMVTRISHGLQSLTIMNHHSQWLICIINHDKPLRTLWSTTVNHNQSTWWPVLKIITKPLSCWFTCHYYSWWIIFFQLSVLNFKQHGLSSWQLGQYQTVFIMNYSWVPIVFLNISITAGCYCQSPVLVELVLCT